MKVLLLLVNIISIFIFTFCQKNIIPPYPTTAQINQVDEYFGHEIADPYRWLEDMNSEDTKTWVEAENKVTQEYLSQIPFREKLKSRLAELWNYERYYDPEKHGDYYLYYKNDGLQEQSIVYIQKGPEGIPEIFIDPNKLSDDGSVSLSGIYFSNNQEFASYSVSRGGSDWREFFVMKVDTKELLNDHIQWAKFTGNAWYKEGFFYSRYDIPDESEKLKASNQFQKLYYHKVGTPQSEDKLILEDKNNPKRGFGASVTDDERFLVINIWEGSANYNLLSFKDLKANSPIRAIFDKPEAHYRFIDNIGDKFLILTDNETSNYKIVLIDPYRPSKNNWTTIIPETKNVIEHASVIADKIIVSYIQDAVPKVSVFNLNGEKLYDVQLPGIGTVSGFYGTKDDAETFYTFESFTNPETLYKYDVIGNTSTLFKKPNLKFDLDSYETKEIFYESKDGTKVPLFIVHKKDIDLDGSNPALLYGYGGFNISMLPFFSARLLPLLENGVVYAMACLRGGSEYGEEWHKAGMLGNKQNVFDDFIAAAEYLINNGYTSNENLAIYGASNGGTLVGTVINQRPELCKVAFPAVGVMDMLRYHKFTIGWAWASEYGSSDNENEFNFLIKYSPLHNIKEGINYPATMITTADHDDRVFPAHSFKYGATLQNKQSGDNPILIRIETKVGHGAGTSTSKSIELYTDMWSFMFYNMDLEPY